MKSFFHKSALCFLSSLIILCSSCTPAKQAESKAPGKPKGTEITPSSERQKPDVRPTAGPSELADTIIAEIADYKITAGEFVKRTILDLHPDPYGYVSRAEPIDANEVLMKILAEKAMAAEARSKNYLQDQEIQELLKQFKETTLVNLLLTKHLKGKIITVSASEIEEKIKTNPQKMDAARAKAMLEREKTFELVDQFYNQLCEKFHVQKLNDNFPKVIQIHQRLFNNARQVYSIKFIGNNQVENELTPKEKQMPLAIYDNGELTSEFTLKDWFEALCDISPPTRPKDLNTIEGVEKLLYNALKIPILLSEANLQELDKDETFLKQLREQEDAALISKVTREKARDINEPTKEQITAYFNDHRKDFETPRTIKIEQIWCENLNAARTARTELDKGRDFDSVAQQYSLEKPTEPLYTSVDSEGMFFEDLWAGEPNEIIGPVKGLYRDSIKWRVVKILGKNPARPQKYSDNMEETVKRKIHIKEGRAIIAEYQKELLKKYPYRIYKNRIINPLDIP